MDAKTRLIREWIDAPSEATATDAVVALGRHLREQAANRGGSYGWVYVPGDRGADWAPEWEPAPAPWEQEPEGWDDAPDPEGVGDD